MPPRQFTRAKPKKGTIKRLLKSLWKNFKWSLFISFVALVLSIITNLSGSVFASLITEVLTKAIVARAGDPSINAFTDMFEINLLNMISLKANLTTLIIALASIYAVGVLCSWTWTRTMAVVCQKYLNLFRIEMFGHMQKLPIKYFDTHQNGQIMSLYTNDIDTIRQFVSSALPNLFATGLTIIGCIFVHRSYMY